MKRPIHNDAEFGLPQAGPDPFTLFTDWFDEARRTDAHNASVMTLSTATPDGHPSGRIVLLKEHGPDGFIFFTNYDSRKGRELTENPEAALTFWWPAEERQVRVEGSVKRIPADQSDAYFASRPRDSRLSAWASAQSQHIDEPVTLDNVRVQFPGNTPVPRPKSWGGFRVVPVSIEFWQGRASRLHDRIRFTCRDGDWSAHRLAP